MPKTKYHIRKTILASSMADALHREAEAEVMEVFAEKADERLTDAIGFRWVEPDMPEEV